MTIRVAGVGDLNRVKALVSAAFTPWIAVIGQVPGPLGHDYAPNLASGQVFLLEDAGLIVLVPQEDVLLLDIVAVDPGAQGRGLGRRLMQFAEEQARARGLDRIRLYTHAKMVSNVTLCQGLGYAETHRITEHGLPRVYMEKILTD